jgi:hypothetical protein
MSRAVMQQVLAALEGGDVMCEVIAAGMLRTELAKPEQIDASIAKSDDLVPVPRNLLGCACYAIREGRKSPTVLARLREYTTGDKSR